MRIEDVVQEFRDAAIRKADFVSPPSDDHVLHKTLSDTWRFLYSQGTDGRMAFRNLLTDQSPHVRLWVASQLLAEGEADAATILEKDTTTEGLHGFSAQMVLKDWRAGRLASPFGAR